MNQILADGVTQVYSSLLYEGPTIFSVFNGVYLNAHDYDTNPETKARIDAHLEGEREMAAWPHTLPDRKGGEWAAVCEVFGANQQRRGSVEVRIRHDPIDLVRATQRWEMSGAIDRSSTYVRTRSNGNRHTYDGLTYGATPWPTAGPCTPPSTTPARPSRSRAESSSSTATTPSQQSGSCTRRPHDRHSLRRPHLVTGPRRASAANWQQYARHPCRTLPIHRAAAPQSRIGSSMHAIRAQRCQFVVRSSSSKRLEVARRRCRPVQSADRRRHCEAAVAGVLDQLEPGA